MTTRSGVRAPAGRSGVRIRLLTSVAGVGPVVGDPGDVLTVPAEVAGVWADGERAELAGDED